MRHARWLLPAALLLAGCVDIGTLEKSFCGAATVALCDDFEAGDQAPAWNQLTQGGTADRVAPDPNGKPMVAYRGERALRLTVPAGGLAALEDDVVTPSLKADGDLYVRIFLYLPAAVPAGTAAVVTLRDGTGMPAASLDLVDGVPRVAAGDRSSIAGAVLAPDTWSCLSLAVLRSDQTPRAALFFGGQPYLEVPQATLPTIAATRIGLDRTGATGTSSTTAWIDDVNVDTKPITCRQ